MHGLQSGCLDGIDSSVSDDDTFPRWNGTYVLPEPAVGDAALPISQPRVL